MEIFARSSPDQLWKLAIAVQNIDGNTKCKTSCADGVPLANRHIIVEIRTAKKNAPVIRGAVKKSGGREMKVKSREEALVYMEHLMRTKGPSA